MAKYVCNMRKEDIINAIIEEFEKVNKDYDDALQTDNEKLQIRNQGRYTALIDLLQKVEIYEK